MDEFTSQGFEVVPQEDGQFLVKLVFMVEGSEQAIEYQATPEDARKILSGEVTIDPAGLLETQQSQEISGQEIDKGVGSFIDAGAIKGEQHMDSVGMDIPTTSHSYEAANKAGAGGSSVPSAIVSDVAPQVSGTEYTITEVTNKVTSASVRGGDQYIQVVTLTDAEGKVLDHKESIHGHKVTLHMNPHQSMEYIPQGPTESGEPIVSTIIVPDEFAMGEASGAVEGGEMSSSAGESLIQQQERLWCPESLTLGEFRQIRQYATQVAQMYLQQWRQKYTVVLYQERMGSYTAYEQMTSLMNFDPNLNSPRALSQFHMMREHSALFRLARNKARPLTKCELGTNEAAAQLCRFHPPLMFYRRDLAGYAKQVMMQLPQQMEGMAVLNDIPDPVTTPARGPLEPSAGPKEAPGSKQSMPQIPGRLPSAGGRPMSATGDVTGGPATAQDVYAASAFANSSIAPRTDSSYKLLPNEEDAIHSMALDIASEIPKYSLKPKSELNTIERFLYDEAEHLMKLQALGQIHQNIDLVRDVALLHGRHPNGQRNYSVPLTPFEVACNEAAAYLVLNNPGLVTHRRDLSEFAKRVVKNCGYYFKHTPVISRPVGSNGQIRYMYGSEYLNSGVDLSMAEMLLNCTGEMDPESRVAAAQRADTTTDLDAAVTKTVDLMEDLNLMCEAENNIVNEVAILSVTGADDVRRVRRLTIPHCAFTGVLPVELNRCVNLVELDLEGNHLSQLPRCLYLPHLRRLNVRENPFATRPLVEQFPKLQSLEIDEKFVGEFHRVVLLHFCPRFRLMNTKPYPGCGDVKKESDESLSLVSSIKSNLEMQVQTMWDQYMAPYYKVGVPSGDAVKVTEMLVFLLGEMDINVSAPWSDYRDLLTRHVSQDFLNPKILDEDDEEVDEEDQNGDVDGDFKLVTQRSSKRETLFPEMPEPEDNEDVSAAVNVDENRDPTKTTEESAESSQEKPVEAGTTEVSATKSAGRRVTWKEPPSRMEPTKSAPVQNGTGSGPVLLPEEPLDPLSRVVGESFFHGKCVVYSVMRTAARQPGSDLLIPVGGGGLSLESEGLTQGMDPDDMDAAALMDNDKEYGLVDDRSAVRRPVSMKKLPLGALSARGRAFSGPASRRPGGMDGQQSSLSMSGKRPRGRPRGSGASLRGGRMPSNQVRQPAFMQSPLNDVSLATVEVLDEHPAPYNSGMAAMQRVFAAQQHTFAGSSYRGGRPRGRPSGSRAGSVAASSTTPAKKSTNDVMLPEIPPLAPDVPVRPHSPPPSSLSITTRQSNRNKRFSQFGAVDVTQVSEDDIVRLTAAKTELDDVDAEEEDATAAEAPEKPKKAVAPEKPASGSRRRKWRRGGDDDDDDFKLDEDDDEIDEQEEEDEEAALEMEVEERQWVKQRPPFRMYMYDDDYEDPLEMKDNSSDEDFDVNAEVAHLRRYQGASRGRRRVQGGSQSQPALFAESGGAAAGGNVSGEYEFLGSDVDENELSPGTGQKRARARGQTAAKRGRRMMSYGGGGGRMRLNPERFRTLSELGKFVDYDPLHFIRCHARDNDPTDSSTKVWRCAFEPRVDNPLETTHVVATCGGECVCLVDCISGKVMKRFKQQDEEFYAVAWTTVEMSPGHFTNLLAAAGHLRQIRLLHPEQLVCYALLSGHEDDIACMCFHPRRPTILFSGDAKATILMWDIGVPTAPEYSTRYTLLRVFTCPRANLNPVLNLVVLGRYDTLVAGCEDGLFVWNIKDYDTAIEKKILPDCELKIPTKQEPCFDGLAKISDNILVTKCVEEGKLFVFDYRDIMQHRKSVKKVNVDVIGELRWQVTEEIYINVTGRYGLASIICGDNEGAIWIYDLKQQANEGFTKKFKCEPTKILDWPECSVGTGGNTASTGEATTSTTTGNTEDKLAAGFKNPVVNASDISSDGRYICTVTDNNLVCVWKFSD